jgi:Phosphotransferase enzyme family
VSATTSELRRELGRIFGVEVQGLLRRPHDYRTSFGLETLALMLADGREITLVFKDLSRSSLDANARLAKPASRHDPLREIEAYRDALPSHDLGTAAYYGSVVDRSRDRYWLFIEHVPGLVLWQIGEHETWRAVARWLALLHESVRPRGNALALYDAALYRDSFERARSAGGSRALDALAGLHDRALDALARLPAAFLHGDFYPSNVLVQKRTDSLRICPIDWESAGIGPGLLDLAALVSGWGEREVVELARTYRDALAEPCPEQEFLNALDYCRLHVAVRWLDSPPGWSPPRGHARDWLTTALQLAEKLKK